MASPQPLPRLDQIPVDALKGVGAALAEKLAKLHFHSLQDVLFHLPHRYMDRTRVSPMGGLQPNTHVVVEGEVRACDVVFGKRRSLVCRLQDGTGSVTLRFYHFNAGTKASLAVGKHLRIFGETRRGSAGLEIYHPEFLSREDARAQPLETSLTAIYPTTEGLTQGRIRALVLQALDWLARAPLAELVPERLRAEVNQCSLADALRFLHQPPCTADLGLLARGEHPVQQRLAFEELLAHHLSLLLLRQETQRDGAPSLPPAPDLDAAFTAQLPFAMTRAQRRVIDEIGADLAKPIPMLRLVQGDVGSGKTVVAAAAALRAIGAGQQVALMAPTEILAEQHRRNLSAWFAPLGIELGWLTGKLKASERKTQLAKIASGAAQMVVGTHALFQDGVEFAALGLIIIDEQHRFGVQQRLSLGDKGKMSEGARVRRPHQLIMTATPIPRTLSMSAYADLDCSIIDELPPGRTPVTTVVISDDRRDQVIARVEHACREGRQAYWVCTLIEESEALEAQAAEATAQYLQDSLPGLRIGLIHGRLKAAEKEAVMQAFKAGELDVLVATTVIEVGVDVANASLMIIENPERLGLAQLHQLRGRVGRGAVASHCVLLYSSPLSAQGRERLRVMRESNDGFYIAEQDLQLRGPGEVLGTRQTGDMQYRVADLLRDAHLLDEVKRVAEQLLVDYPEQSRALLVRWLGRGHEYLQA